MEKFIKVEDDKYLSNRHEIIINGRRFEVGIWKVIFGFRIRGGYVNSGMITFDWCCGANPAVIQATQKVLMDLIERGTDFQIMPKYSDIKPWPNDLEFAKKVDELYGDSVFTIFYDLFGDKTIIRPQ